MVVIIYYWCMNTMRNPFRISFFHPKFCINRLVGADHYKPKLRISTNLRSWTKFASSEHANENCTKIAQILRHMDESCTKIARIASDEKCAEIARKIARKIQSGQAVRKRREYEKKKKNTVREFGRFGRCWHS